MGTYDFFNRAVEFATDRGLVDPETFHEAAFLGMEALQEMDTASSKRLDEGILIEALEDRLRVENGILEQEFWGERFDNPVGIAAGFDKNARVVPALESLGFGYVEIGGVTPQYQAGNPGQRMWRGPGESVINRMGFNNHGADIVSERLYQHRQDFDLGIPVGVNLAELHTGEGVDIEHGYRDPDGFEDYGELASETIRRFRENYGDVAYWTAVFSCPNTAGDRIEEDFGELETSAEKIAREADRPVLGKISPDPAGENIRETVATLAPHLDGFVATNTSTRIGELLEEDVDEEAEGGLSGEPIKEPSTRTVAAVYGELQRQGIEDERPVIGVGGVSSAEDAYEKIRAGASLLQLYTGLVYKGPAVARDINEGLLDLLDEGGFDHVSEARGTLL